MGPVDSKFFSENLKWPGAQRQLWRWALPIPSTRHWDQLPSQTRQSSLKTGISVLGDACILSWATQKLALAQPKLLDFSRFELLRAKFSRPGSKLAEISLCGSLSPLISCSHRNIWVGSRSSPSMGCKQPQKKDPNDLQNIQNRSFEKKLSCLRTWMTFLQRRYTITY